MLKKLKLRRSHALIFGGITIIGMVIWLWLSYQNKQKWPETFGYGKTANQQDIAKWDIDVRPDGKGLPPGSGNVADGAIIYTSKCAACHGADGKEVKGVKLPGPPLVVGGGKTKTIGNYWPYATTLFDYVRRAMPYNAPGSLTDDEVYSLCAWLLNENKIIKANQIMNARTLPKVEMPAQKLFIVDDRKGGPEVK
ncbi:cytochrome c [Mucilaginibacter gossypiicola]|uniref:Cytochrome c n=1 Tax=Mucilaginibacter gossypiicola TaxID=551995 RepID=A0A1H8JSF9_9SPHI|nr:cytochrome c [Mucilaginibacter gossypiicola]SEN83491.1 cytochrome c [Mucilaginibacter gossypiicola]